jgi:ABC-type bacteriocin/lantibiotic exporter with double-glycine peptidase domain
VLLALNLSPLFQVYAASDRIKELMDVPTTTKGTLVPAGPIEGNLELKNVEFSYP